MEYKDRDIIKLAEYYTTHVQAMTAEGLHSKSDIAAELAHRDVQIDRLRGQLQNCVNYLERAKRKHPNDNGNYCVAIESANAVLYETLHT